MNSLTLLKSSSLKKTIILGVIISSWLHSYAQNHDNPIDSAVRGKFTFNGYIDSYYMINSNNPKSGLNTGASGFARAFDQRERQFQLGVLS